MGTVEFRRLLDEQNALRVRFVLQRDQVLEFMVQLECQFEGKWCAVARYDTAHGFAHRDLLHPHRSPVKTEMRVRNFNKGLTFAIRDLAEHWQIYRERYQEWQSK